MLTAPLLALALAFPAQTHSPAAHPADQPAAHAPAPAERIADYDRWYAVEMMGAKAGWMHTQLKSAGDKVTTRSKMSITMGRAGAGIEISMASEFVESQDGKPISMRSQSKMGNDPVDTTWTFGAENVEVVTRQGGRTKTETVPAPKGEWTTPAALEQQMLARFRAGEKRITGKTLSPEYGLTVVSQTRTGFTDDTVTVDGQPVKALKTSVETDAVQGVASTEWLDAEGDLIKSETNLGGIAITMTRTSKVLAQEQADGPAPEVMVKTFVKPDKPIDDPRHSSRAVFLLTTTDGDMPALPSSAAQKVEKVDAHSARVTVDALHPQPASPDDLKNAAFLASTVNADLADEKLTSLAAKVLKEAPADKAKRAELLRRAVYEHISDKNLSTAMATASEVVRSRAGDCSEHGVLLAALLRADKIPSRVATGIIYADAFAGEKQIFGYHMWAQALLEGPDGPRWVDLDATFPPNLVFDATHIAIAHFDLGDNTINQSLVNLAMVLGRLEVKVESVEHARPNPDKPAKDNDRK
ncbi:MAG: transglutaminase-like domain-containing protein [Phycisphaerales bacterium]